MKKCFKCNRELPLTEFYRHPQMGDGHLGKCKGCTKSDVSENYRNRRPQYQAYERSRLHNPQRIAARQEHSKQLYKEDPERVRAYKRRWCEQNSHKRRAQCRLNNAIRDGKITRQPCERCNAAKAQGHHEDYSKPLDVMWLCTRCHADRHMELRDMGIVL